MITMIAAMCENRVIGKDNGLPRDYPEDMQRFKDMTLNKPIVMGRKTFDSMGRALPKRRNIMLSRSPMSIPGVETFDSIQAILDATAKDPEVMIIGGQTIYEQFLPYADRIELTIIHKNIEGDTFFPVFEKDFCEVKRDNRGEYSFITYNRK